MFSIQVAYHRESEGCLVNWLVGRQCFAQCYKTHSQWFANQPSVLHQTTKQTLVRGFLRMIRRRRDSDVGFHDAISWNAEGNAHYR